MPLGQSSLMVGFPSGLPYAHYEINNGFPIPFIKSATLSGSNFANDTVVHYWDGHNNPGFSGGLWK